MFKKVLRLIVNIFLSKFKGYFGVAKKMFFIGFGVGALLGFSVGGVLTYAVFH
ncbi:MAG: hypothetical protein Q8O87_02415 [bacterium]|nr:hypothetical protein [bacterium]